MSAISNLEGILATRLLRKEARPFDVSSENDDVEGRVQIEMKPTSSTASGMTMRGHIGADVSGMSTTFGELSLLDFIKPMTKTFEVSNRPSTALPARTYRAPRRLYSLNAKHGLEFVVYTYSGMAGLASPEVSWKQGLIAALHAAALENPILSTEVQAAAESLIGLCAEYVIAEPSIDFDDEGNLELFVKKGNSGLLFVFGASGNLFVFGNSDGDKWRASYQVSGKHWISHIKTYFESLT